MNSPHKGQWRGALIFSLICARMDDWLNNREAGDMRRHRDHYDVTVIIGSSLAKMKYQAIALSCDDQDLRHHDVINSHSFNVAWFDPRDAFTYICIHHAQKWLHIFQWRQMSTMVSKNHQQTDCLFSKLLRPTANTHQRSTLPGLSDGNPPVIGGFPSQRVSNAESVSTPWRQHVRA